MYESGPGGRESVFVRGRVIRKDYELMNMYHFPSDTSCGAGRRVSVSSLVLSWHKLLSPFGILS